jgi:hypothetical protein
MPLTFNRLERMWVEDDPASEDLLEDTPAPFHREESQSSTVSMGDTHVWREVDNGEAQ